MKFIKQAYKSQQCGQTCLAMILDMSVQDIIEDLSKNNQTEIVGDLQRYLDKKGYKTRLISGAKISFEEIPNESIIFIKYQSGNVHAIVKHDYKYYDPECGILLEPIGHFVIESYIIYEKLNEE